MAAWAAGAFAQEVSTVMVDPVTVSIALAKGETKTGVFKATNNSGEKMSVTVPPRDWFMAPENEDIPLRSWLMIEPAEFDMDPGAEQEVTYTVKVPESAVGELAAMIAFKPKPKEGQAVNVVFSVSLYAVLIGTDKIECNVTDFKIWKMKDRKALGMKVSFNNTGNIHIKPMTEVFIHNEEGQALQKAQLPYGAPVYPGKSASFDGNIYNFRLKPGMYTAVIDTDFTNVGQKYQKTVYIVAGKGGEILGSSMKSPDDIKTESEAKLDMAPQKMADEAVAPGAAAAEELPGSARPRTIELPRKKK